VGVIVNMGAVLGGSGGSRQRTGRGSTFTIRIPLSKRPASHFLTSVGSIFTFVPACPREGELEGANTSGSHH